MDQIRKMQYIYLIHLGYAARCYSRKASRVRIPGPSCRVARFSSRVIPGVAPIMAGQMQVPYGGGRKPGGDSPRVCARQAKEQGVVVVRCNARSDVARSVFFSSLFFFLFFTSRALSRSFAAISRSARSHPRRAPAVGGIGLEQHPAIRSKTESNHPFCPVVFSLSLSFSSFSWRRISHRHFDAAKSLIVLRFFPCGSQGKSEEIARV